MTDGPDLERMTDEERAEYYYAHRHDPDFDAQWEDVGHAGPRRLSTVVSVRFDPDDAHKVLNAAESAGMTLSAYVRQCTLDAARGVVVDVERVRYDVREARRRMADAWDALTRRPAS